MNIVLAGGTGFIGKELVHALGKEGHRVVLLTRKSTEGSSRLVTEVQWDGKTLDNWASFMDGADAVINLCGESIAAKRWSEQRKKALLASRLETTHALIEAISKVPRKPEVLINASGAGYYGNRPDEMLTESAPAGKGYLAQTCITWELEARRAEAHGVRTVMLRMGMVLEKGGALEKIAAPFRFYLGGPLGNGKQGLAWIHRDDVIGIILHLLNHRDLSGPVNVVAPEAVTNVQFSNTLGKILHRPSWLPAPAWTLKLLMGEMAGELLLSGQQPVPAKLLRSGYQFKFSGLEAALRDILAK